MKQAHVRKILVVVSILCVLSVTSMLVYVTQCKADDKSYSNCVQGCYLDLPKVSECVEQERAYWDAKHTNEAMTEKDCISLIKHERINCEIDCLVKEIKMEDPNNAAIKFYDENVKNFPLTSQ